MSGTVGDNIARASGVIAAAGGGAWNLIQSQTASSSTYIEFTTQITSTYDVYKIFLTNVHHSGDADSALFQFRQSGSYLTYDYRYAVARVVDSSSTVDAAISQSAAHILLNRDATGSATGEGYSMEITIWDPLGTDNYKKIHYNGANINHDGTIKHELGAGAWVVSTLDNTAAMDGVKIFTSAGNIASGTFAIYGLAKS